MIRNLKIFWLLSTLSAKTAFQHRVGMISFISGKIVRFAFYFFFIYFLVSKTRFLAGYSLLQTLIFFLSFNFIDALTQLLFREVYRFRPLIISGEFDGVLLKPYHPFIRILIVGIDIMDTITIIPYIFVLVYYIFQIPHLNSANLLLYGGFLLNGLVIATGFHIIILAFGILTTEIDNIIMIYRDFTKMLSLPVDIYKEPLRSFLLFVIPIGIMMAVPVKVLFGLLTFNMFIISVIVTFLFMFFSLFLWNKALKKYQSWGS